MTYSIGPIDTSFFKVYILAAKLWPPCAANRLEPWRAFNGDSNGAFLVMAEYQAVRDQCGHLSREWNLVGGISGRSIRAFGRTIRPEE